MAHISILEAERTKNLDYAVLLVELSTRFSMDEMSSLASTVLGFIADTPELQGKELYEVVTFSLAPDANMSGLTSLQRAARSGEGSVDDYLKTFEVIYTIVPKSGVASFGFNILKVIAEMGEGRAKQVKVENTVEALLDIQKRRNEKANK